MATSQRVTFGSPANLTSMPLRQLSVRHCRYDSSILFSQLDDTLCSCIDLTVMMSRGEQEGCYCYLSELLLRSA
jgi:hypothetical protein